MPELSGPAIILCEPQLGENIGAVARAMLNCGLTDLRLVAPRDGWPSDSARASAAGADTVIDATRVFETLEEAIADLHLVLATTARSGDLVKQARSPTEAAPMVSMWRRSRALGFRPDLVPSLSAQSRGAARSAG